MVALIQLLIVGVLLGSVYALLSSGLTLVFGVMKVVNLAHGAFAIVAAYLTFTLWRWLGMDPLLSIPIVIVVMFALGWIAYTLVIRHVRNSHMSMTVLATFGIALVLEGTMGFIWTNRSSSIRTAYTDSSVNIGPISIPLITLLAAGIAMIVLAGLYVVLNKTWAGRAIRAASANESAAMLVGISVKAIAARSFAVGIATLGAGGAIIAAMYPFIPGSHYLWIARLLAIVVLGGLGSLMGAVVGAVLIGVVEQLATQYIGASWIEAIPFLVIFLVLLIRPQGIMGERLREDAAA